MSFSAAGHLCDVAPSRFERIERDGYFTLDADWMIPALCRAVYVKGPILEPCAGRGHMVHALRALGFTVHAPISTPTPIHESRCQRLRP
jgi:hypothetical protein